jgi:nucleoside-diphosphate-sugar epimerase
MSPVLVTGGSGYIATQLIAALARTGQSVRATARSADRDSTIRAALERGGVSGAELEVVVADLSSDAGWAGAMDGVEEVHHVASPIPVVQPEDPDDLIAPARDGTLRVLRAARDAGVRRVVLTSSFAAIGYSPKPVRDYDESDWTDPDSPGLAPYPRSKTVAERAAWDFMAAEGGDLELVVINPTFVAGPSLTTELRSSLTLTKMLIEGTMTVVPRQRFGIVDVRDVADVHLRAMAVPDAAGRRYLVLADGPTLSFLDLAQILREHLGPKGERIPTEEAEGPELSALVIHNDRAKAELGFAPRPARSTITETADNLFELGLIDQ